MAWKSCVVMGVLDAGWCSKCQGLVHMHDDSMSSLGFFFLFDLGWIDQGNDGTAKEFLGGPKGSLARLVQVAFLGHDESIGQFNDIIIVGNIGHLLQVHHFFQASYRIALEKGFLNGVRRFVHLLNGFVFFCQDFLTSLHDFALDGLINHQ